MGTGLGGLYASEPAASSATASDSIGNLPAPNERPTNTPDGLAPKSLAENALAMRNDYELHPDGMFAERGNKGGIRVHRSDNPIDSSWDFFKRITKGGKAEESINVDAYMVPPTNRA